jgi:hypothetical protein
MSTYQRYLRERKEVEIEEADLEEAQPVKGAEKKELVGLVKADRASGRQFTGPNSAAIGTGTPAGQNAIDLAIKQDARRKEVEKRVAQRKEAEKNKNLFPDVAKGGSPVPSKVDVKPLSGTTSPTPSTKLGSSDTSKNKDKDVDSKPAEDPSADITTKPSSGNIKVIGNTISEILSSAGITDTSKVRNIITAFQEAAKDNNLKIKDGFLS